MSAVRSDWAVLLRLALPALDHVFPRREPGGAPDWTFGGGTAIMLQIDHRISHDIDIFVHGARLKRFTPAANPAAAQISSRFQWPGHYLKFERPEGEVDFLSAGLQTDPGYTWRTIEDRPIALETPEEVVVKKVRFRSERFTARDAFDLAAVAAARPGLEAVLAEEVADALPRLDEALRVLEAKGTEALRTAIIPTGMGVALLPDALGRARSVVGQAAGLVRQRHA